MKKNLNNDHFHFELPEENAAELRCMLHPTIQRAWKIQTDTWFPGMREQTKELRDARGKKEEMPVEGRIRSKHYFQTKLFKYSIEDVEEARHKFIIRGASDYIESDKKERQEQMKKDEGIIAKKTVLNKVTKKEEVLNVPFHTLFKRDIPVEKDLYLNRKEMYRPVSSHQFRSNQKQQWIDGAFKLF